MEMYESPLERGLISSLRESRKRWGELYPIIKAKNGRVIDGRHRRAAGWESSITLDVEDDIHIIALRLTCITGEECLHKKREHLSIH
jgi:hypothetical protein